MDKQQIRARLDDTRRELRDVLVSGRSIGLDHGLVDPAFKTRTPGRSLSTWDTWALSLAQGTAQASALFPRDEYGRADAGPTALFATQLKYFIAEFFGDYYPVTDCRSWLSVDTSLPVGAIEYSARRVLRHGDLRAVGALAHDVPIMTVGAAEDIFRNVEYQGKILYTLAQLEHAAFSGFPLEREELVTLSMAAERNFEAVWHVGDNDYGTWGFYNGAAVTAIPLYAVVTGTWATATHDQIIGDVRALMYGIKAATNVSMLYPDTIVFPESLVQYLGVRRANTDITVRKAIQEEWPGVRLFSSFRADTLDAAGTGPRILAMASTRAASRFGVPRELEMLPPQQVGAAFESIGRQNLAGAILPQPLAFGHMDGC